MKTQHPEIVSKAPGSQSPGDEFTPDHHLAGTSRSAPKTQAAGVSPDHAAEDVALGRAFTTAHRGADSARDRAYDDVVHSRAHHEGDSTPAEGPQSDGDDDDEEIFAITGHIPDRDQTFGVDHKDFPGTANPANEYEGDEEDAVKGDRDTEGDALDDLQHVGHITRPEARDPRRSPTPAPMAGNLGSDLDGLSEEELTERARVLGIPGRAQMNHTQLAQAVQDAAHHV